MGALRGPEAQDTYLYQEAIAQQRGAALYGALVARIQEQTTAERRRGDAAYTARRLALERIGLPNVRKARLAQLSTEEVAWRAYLERRASLRPALQALILLRVICS